MRKKTYQDIARGRASAPGDDGITYSVLRLLLKVTGAPLLQPYNLCLRHGYVPQGWTKSLVVPVPKPGTDKFRPISLTSCFCKVLESPYVSPSGQTIIQVIWIPATTQHAPLSIGAIHSPLLYKSCRIH
ncbi:uncharacterized protein LOC134765254 [Penaeus indicus]|uniref:uncharacterized protein LOC134765254 n=1 Tax=Penaeus indicus TaxID=29960 RepID=UPI00300C4470